MDFETGDVCVLYKPAKYAYTLAHTVFFFLADSAFKQQRLPAWQPILTAGTVLPTFFVIGIAFIPVGIGLLYFSDEVKEMVIDYTDCKSSELVGGRYRQTNETCYDIISNSSDRECNCSIPFTLESDFKVNTLFGISCVEHGMDGFCDWRRSRLKQWKSLIHAYNISKKEKKLNGNAIEIIPFLSV